MEYKDYKLTNEQLIKALDHCTSADILHCADECPIKGDGCISQLLWNAARRIKVLSDENVTLKSRIRDLRLTANSYEDRNKALDKECSRLRAEIGIVRDTNKKYYDSNQSLTETIHKLQAEIADVKSEMQSEMEQRCDECKVPDVDPNDCDLMELVDDIINTCYSLIRSRRMRPAVLFRYVEDVIHDRERRRLRDEEEEE